MSNHGRNRRTGQFISRRVQNVQRLADLPDREWDLDDEAMAILEGGIALAIKDGWIEPTVPTPAPDCDGPDVQAVGEADPDRQPDPDPDSWIDALKDTADS